MKKWKTVKDEYHNINNILNFHRSTMHHKSNMSVNHIIPVIDNLLTKDNEEDSRIVEIDPAELKENEDEFFKILEQRRTSWQFGTPMNREQLSALLTKAFGISQRRKFGEFWVNLKTYASAGALYSVSINKQISIFYHKCHCVTAPHACSVSLLNMNIFSP